MALLPHHRAASPSRRKNRHTPATPPLPRRRASRTPASNSTRAGEEISRLEPRPNRALRSMELISRRRGDGELGGDLVQHPVSGDTGEPGLVGEQQPVGQHGVDQGLDVVRGNEGAARHGGPGPGGRNRAREAGGWPPSRTMGWLRVAPTKETK